MNTDHSSSLMDRDNDSPLTVAACGRILPFL